jgi:hypothetical protein
VRGYRAPSKDTFFGWAARNVATCAYLQPSIERRVGAVEVVRRGHLRGQGASHRGARFGPPDVGGWQGQRRCYYWVNADSCLSLLMSLVVNFGVVFETSLLVPALLGCCTAGAITGGVAGVAYSKEYRQPCLASTEGRERKDGRGWSR